MMGYACLIWRSTVFTHVQKLQVLLPKCLRNATNAPWYFITRQIYEDLEISFFAYQIRALFESFESKLTDVGSP
jgi:hypothetical protein